MSLLTPVSPSYASSGRHAVLLPATTSGPCHAATVLPPHQPTATPLPTVLLPQPTTWWTARSTAPPVSSSSPHAAGWTVVLRRRVPGSDATPPTNDESAGDAGQTPDGVQPCQTSSELCSHLALCGLILFTCHVTVYVQIFTGSYFFEFHESVGIHEIRIVKFLQFLLLSEDSVPRTVSPTVTELSSSINRCFTF